MTRSGSTSAGDAGGNGAAPRQVLQSLRTGKIELVEVPVPVVNARTILVETRASVISPGTERMLVEFGRGSLLDKVRQQPERVEEVIRKIRADGLGPTIEAVRAKLDRPIPLGYCNAGIVREVGRDVTAFAPGDRVVTNGPHAEYVRVPTTLAARIPDGLPFEDAAFAPLAAIALQGFRLAQPTLGETVVVYGLGLVGLLTVQIARAGGCRVIGIDRNAERLEIARGFGAEAHEATPEADLPQAIRRSTGGVGADVVLLTLASESDEPVHLAAEMSRKRARLVLVGVSGLNLKRADFYEKELSLQVSCSYGPGRYDQAHEEGGRDYPLPYVRWTEGRNFAATLELMAAGRVTPSDLVSHSICFARTRYAYDLVASNNEPTLGIVLRYPGRGDDAATRRRTIQLPEPPPRSGGKGVVGFVGAGSFGSRVLMPAFAKAGAELDTVVSAGGTSSALAARTYGFRMASTDVESVLENPEIDTVVIATRHDTHGEYVLRALAARKHVYVEKPLAIRPEEVDRIEQALERTDRILCVGFNRRFAPLAMKAKKALDRRDGPLAISITVNAGRLPDDHWTKDPAVGGGRLVGEACHFIDLARHLAGAPIVDMVVTHARDGGSSPIEDISLMQLAFADGSIGTIQYLANGPKGLPKERVELFWDGKGMRIDNWRRIEGWGVAMLKGRVFRRQEKGHRATVGAFLRAVRSGVSSPIARAEVVEVGRWSATLGRHREGGEIR